MFNDVQKSTIFTLLALGKEAGFDINHLGVCGREEFIRTMANEVSEHISKKHDLFSHMHLSAFYKLLISVEDIDVLPYIKQIWQCVSMEGLQKHHVGMGNWVNLQEKLVGMYSRHQLVEHGYDSGQQHILLGEHDHRIWLQSNTARIHPFVAGYIFLTHSRGDVGLSTWLTISDIIYASKDPEADILATLGIYAEEFIEYCMDVEAIGIYSDEVPLRYKAASCFFLGKRIDWGK